jgi:hypothetical protein
MTKVSERRVSPSLLYPALITGLIALGIVLRARQYFINRSLWLDEAMLADNIVNRSFRGLLQPLDYSQGSPIGFLIIEKISTRFLGNQDYVLRAFPFLAGIVSIFLFFILTNYLLSRPGVVLALSLFIFNDKLIYYASEVKQYATDVAVAMLLLVYAISLTRNGSKSKKQYLMWGFVASFCVWFSHPALFILIGISTGLFIQVREEKNWANFRWLGWATFTWSAAFLLDYLISLRQLTNNTVLIDYWVNYYMPIPPWSDVGWFPTMSCELFQWQLSVSNCWVVAILFFLGVGSFLIFKQQWGIMLSLPFLVALGVSSFHLYPFGQRPLLFLVPLTVILIAGGVELFIRITRLKTLLSSGVWILFSVFLLAGTFVLAYKNFTDPPRKEDIKPVLSSIAEAKETGDLICINVEAKPAYDFYAIFFGLPLDPCILSLSSLENPENYSAELRTLTSSDRVWFLFSHKRNRLGIYPERKFLEMVNRLGKRSGRFKSEGVTVYLVKLGESN